MGLHTWFYKDIKIYEQINELNQKKSFSNLSEIENKIWRLKKINETEFHDCFRISCYRADGKSINSIILKSKDECVKFIIRNKKHITYFNADYVAKFWDKYPYGYIKFG